MSRPALDPAMDEAIDWKVCLGSGQATPTDHECFIAWRQHNTRNQEAWNTLHRSIGAPLAAVRDVETRSPGQARDAREILLRPARRAFMQGLVLAATAGGTALLVERVMPWGGLTADLRTATAELKTFTLDDGSTVTLKPRSSVDIDFQNDARRLWVRSGEIVVQVAPDRLRPFTVATPHGTARALGTRFLVARDEAHTRVSVLEHSVEVGSLDGSRDVLQTGNGAILDGAGIHRYDASQFTGAEWLQGHLVVERQPLSFVIEELQRYRSGYIRLSPRVADIPVQGAFPLADTDRALRGLADTLPIRVTRYGPFLTLIDAR